MKQVKYLFVILTLLAITSLSYAQNKHKGEVDLPKLLPKTSDEVNKFHQEKSNSTVFENNSKILDNISNSPLNFYALDYYLAEMWDGSVWVNSDQGDYTYNAQGWTTEVIYQSWNSGSWVNTNRYTYTYTGNGQVATGVYQDWSGSDWVNSYRYSYTYNSNGDYTNYLYEQCFVGKLLSVQFDLSTEWKFGHRSLPELVRRYVGKFWKVYIPV